MTGSLTGAARYRQTEVQSRTPLELVVMLYDGALVAMAAARDAIARRDIAARAAAISKAISLIGELQATLDMDQGKDIAASLDRLYYYVSGRLLDVTKDNDVQALDEASRLIATLREAWQTIATNASTPPR